MAENGILYLKNESLVEMYEAINTYGTSVIDTLYEAYKNTFKLSKTNYFRGDAADSFKGYLTNGSINIMTEMMDIVSDITMVIQVITEAFYQYENTIDGRVREYNLDYIKEALDEKEQIFDDSKQELRDVIDLARQYISIKPLEVYEVNDNYSATRTSLKEIREGLYAVDDESLELANELLERITKLKTFINSMMQYCYNEDGTINADKLNYIDSQGWFYKAGNVELYLKLQEDPFAYEAGETTLLEDQWAVGLCSNVYAYAGYKVLTAEGECGVEDGTAFAKGKAAVASANGYAQFTDYLRAEAEIKVGYAEGEAKAGFSDDYKGFRVDAKVGLLNANGTVVLGSDEINAFVKGEVKVLCANGKVACEFEDDGEFAVGFDASATVASANANLGVSFLDVTTKDSVTGEKVPLFGFKVKAGGTLGGSAAAWAESKTAIETEYVNINSTTVKVKLGLGLDLEAQVTVPTFYINSEW